MIKKEMLLAVVKLKQQEMRKNKNHQLKINNSQTINKGFSLVEVLISLFILAIGLVSVSFLMASSISGSANSKNQVVASQLVQEGIELVRNVKDDNPTFVTNVTSGDYRIDYLMSSIDASSNYRLYQKNNFFTHDSTGTDTKFYRKITVLVSAPDDRGKKTLTVTATVSWNGTGIPSTCNIANKCVSTVAVMPDLN